MKEHDKHLFALVLLNCALLLTLVVAVKYAHSAVKKVGDKANAMTLTQFRDSAPLPAKVTGVKSETSANPVVAKKLANTTSALMGVKKQVILDNVTKTFLGHHVITFYSTETMVPGRPHRTRTGTTPKPYYTAAVDPRVIPLNSMIEIEGFGVLKAEDTGGAIKGNRIDVYVPTPQHAFKHGRQVRKVYKIETQ